MMLQDLVAGALQNALQDMGVHLETPIPFEHPRQPEMGHLSTTVAMGLARTLRKAPIAIAQDLVQRLGSVPKVASITAAGAGFINFTFMPEAFHDVLTSLDNQGIDIGRSFVGKGRTANVEYVSANPTGPLHAGHGRNCALGDTIANVLEFSGYQVTREYYFNNAGNQMNKLGESIAARVCELLEKSAVVAFPDDGYHGEYIRQIAADLVANATGTIAGFISAADVDGLKEFCKKAGEAWCFESIKQTLLSLNIVHSVYFNEDSLYTSGGVADTINKLRERGLVYEKDGALWFALSRLAEQDSKVERQDKVIVKSTGEPTYRLPDIAYHVDKLERGYNMVVDIFGADHIATVSDVLSGVEALGYDVSRVQVVIHQMVTFIEDGEVVKFSKRSGKSFTLNDLISEVGADVVRFFFVMRAPGTHLDFDLGLAKEEGDKNPVFYLLYAHARICSILRKAGANAAEASRADLSVLVHPRELELISLLSRFRATVERVAETLEPHTLTEYLRDVAASYHQFYHDCRILGSEPKLEQARLRLASVTRCALRNGLTVLGVAAPESM